MEWRNKRVLIIGAARQGTVLASYLSAKGAQVVVTDMHNEDELASVMEELSEHEIEWQLGGHPIKLLDEVDFVCPSGGVPLDIPIVKNAIEGGIGFTNDSQIFLDEAPCSVIGITGSAGKSTTTSLVGAIAQVEINAHSQNGERKAWVGGNLGSPLLADIENMRPDDLAVMELSSFQLEIMTSSPPIAVMLNITPNHLDRHGTMEAYTAAKINILKNQTENDIAVLNRDDSVVWGLAEDAAGRIISFGADPLQEGQLGSYIKEGGVWVKSEEGEVKVIQTDQIPLLGKHNLQNVLAACAIASAAGLSVEAMRQGILEFSGIPHRMEFVRRWGGADWYNDSIATAPERSIAAIQAFDRPIVLLAGGQDKDLPWDDFAQVVKERVDHLITFGEARELIANAVGKSDDSERPYTLDQCETLEEAIKAAVEVVEVGDVVLLSPGGTSYDAFLDFEERGNYFVEGARSL